MFVTAFFSEAGVPRTGLAPTVDIRRVSDGVLIVTGAAMPEVGSGFYRFDFVTAVDGVQYAILCDSVVLTGAERFVYAGGDPDDTATIASEVWLEAVRTLTVTTGLTPAQDAQLFNIPLATSLSDIAAISLAVWAEAVRTLTSSAGLTPAENAQLFAIPLQISASDLTAIAASVLGGGDIDGFTLEEAQKLILASAAGALAGAATNTVTIEAVDGSKIRLTASVDAVGNRLSVTQDATG